MSHDSRPINALAKGYVTNFLLHLGGDANYNLRQKKNVSRFLTDRGLDPKKFAWFVQTQINGWNCATTPQVADYGDKPAQRTANRKAIFDFIKARISLASQNITVAIQVFGQEWDQCRHWLSKDLL